MIKEEVQINLEKPESLTYFCRLHLIVDWLFFFPSHSPLVCAELRKTGEWSLACMEMVWMRRVDFPAEACWKFITTFFFFFFKIPVRSEFSSIFSLQSWLVGAQL